MGESESTPMARLYKELNDKETLEMYLDRLDEFWNEKFNVTKHAYDMHSSLSFETLMRPTKSGKVSYFKGRNDMDEIIRIVIRDFEDEILNFMVSRSAKLEMVENFKSGPSVGYVLTDDDTIETWWAKVVICKDEWDGHLFVKTAYPILEEDITYELR